MLKPKNKKLFAQKENAEKFLENFLSKYEPGDIVYGFGEERAKVLDTFKMLKLESSKYPLLIDSYNNMACLLWSIFNKSLPDEQQRQPTQWGPLFYPAWNCHQFVCKFEFPAESTYKNRRYYNSTSNLYAQDQGRLITFIKKRCKSGILWQLSRDKKIHFLLKRINFKECFTKKINKYTYSELRFIYRHWADLYCYYQKELINFWDEKDGVLELVKAPWLEDKNISHNYIPNIHKPKKQIRELIDKSWDSSILCKLRKHCRNRAEKLARYSSFFGRLLAKKTEDNLFWKEQYKNQFVKMPSKEPMDWWGVYHSNYISMKLDVKNICEELVTPEHIITDHIVHVLRLFVRYHVKIPINLFKSKLNECESIADKKEQIISKLRDIEIATNKKAWLPEENTKIIELLQESSKIISTVADTKRLEATSSSKISL